MFLTIWISYFLLLTRLGSLIKTQIPESQLVPRGSEPLWMRSEKSGMWISKLPWVTLQYKDQYKTSQDKTLQCYSSPCFSAGLWKFPPKHLSSTCRTTSGTYQLSTSWPHFVSFWMLLNHNSPGSGFLGSVTLEVFLRKI